MIAWALTFFVIACIAGILGYGEIARAANTLAVFQCWVFALLSVSFLVASAFKRDDESNSFTVGFDPRYYSGLERGVQCKCCRVWTTCHHGWCFGCHGDMRKVDGMLYERDAEISRLRAALAKGE